MGRVILDAWWEGDTLVILSPRFDRLHVPLRELPALACHDTEALKRFEIDEDGAFIYWPDLDVHLGWEQLLQAVDPSAALRDRQASVEFNKRYGAALRAIRVSHGLRQSDISGLTPRQVGRIERGECRATHAALEKMARACRMSAPAILAEAAAAMA